MTAVGLLCRQYIGAKRTDPMMIDGVKYLMANMPDVRTHNTYYWYYATQVLHNYAGSEWDAWNRAMRKVLINTQNRDKNPVRTGVGTRTFRPGWLGPYAGRHLMTTLSCLTSRYTTVLPLYKVNAEEDEGAAAPAGHKAVKAPAKGK